METEATYFIDAGDAFFKNPYVVQSKREKLTATAEAILQSYNIMGCQVMNIGMNDLAAGYDFIEKLQDQADFPFISANIMQVNTEKLLFAESAIIRTQAKTLGFVGVTIGDKRLKEFTFSDPVEAANRAVAALRDKVDLVFLLANVDDRTETTLTKEVAGIDFLIRSKTGSMYRNPKEKNDVVIIRNGKQGKYAGALKITQVDKVSKLKNVSAQRTRIKFTDNRLQALSRDLEVGQTLEERYAEDEKRLQLIKRLQKEKQDNMELIKTLKNSYFYEPIPLNDKVEDAPEVAEIVADYMPKKNKTSTKDQAKAALKEKQAPRIK